MKSILLLIVLSLFTISIGAENDVPDRGVRFMRCPQVPSKLDLKAVKTLLEKGITKAELSKKISTLPIIRIGPGYVLYFLKDGHVVIPLYESDEVVQNWKLTPTPKKSVEQGIAPDR